MRTGSMLDRQLGRNVVSSGVATACDWMLVQVLLALAVCGPVLATVLGCLLGGITNFSINRRWTFAVGGAWRGQAARYFVVSASSAALNGLGVALLHHVVGIGVSVAWLVTRVAVFVAWNHRLQRDYVFAGRHESASAGG